MPFLKPVLADVAMIRQALPSADYKVDGRDPLRSAPAPLRRLVVVALEQFAGFIVHVDGEEEARIRQAGETGVIRGSIAGGKIP